MEMSLFSCKNGRVPEIRSRLGIQQLFFVYEGFEQFSLPPSKLDLNHRLPIGSKVVPFWGYLIGS